MQFIIVRPEVQVLAGRLLERLKVFDRHQEFEQFDHLREGASSRNSMLESV